MISRAGKRTGKHKSWFNLRYELPEVIQGSVGPVNLAPSLLDWEQVEDVIEAAFYNHESDMHHEAKQKRLQAWKDLYVYEKIQEAGQTAITVRWVLSTKIDGTLKARLVARGFQDPDAENVVKDSPTCARDTFRLLLALHSSS